MSDLWHISFNPYNALDWLRQVGEIGQIQQKNNVLNGHGSSFVTQSVH